MPCCEQEKIITAGHHSTQRRSAVGARCPNKTLSFVFIGCIVLVSVTWYYIKDSEWHPLYIRYCDQTQNSIEDTEWHPPSIQLCNQTQNSTPSRWELLKPQLIDRMLYEMPELLKPKRVDVMTVTPWLAPIVWNGVYNTDILNDHHHKRGTRIGLTVFVIRKYVQFIPTFLKTAEKFFMTGHHVNYYIFTDQPGNIPNITLAAKRQLIVLEAPSYKRWQDITMRRMQIIRDHVRERFINEVDYLVCVDVDMEFTDQVGVEILGNLVAIIHPGFFTKSRKQFPNERRPQSAGYIPEDEGDFYYTGCFFAGNIEEVYKLTNHCHHAMLADKAKNMEALWHDESYLNRYFLYYKPTRVLSPEYAWNHYFGDPPVGLNRNRFIAIQKDYAKVRN